MIRYNKNIATTNFQYLIERLTFPTTPIENIIKDRNTEELQRPAFNYV